MVLNDPFEQTKSLKTVDRVPLLIKCNVLNVNGD